VPFCLRSPDRQRRVARTATRREPERCRDCNAGCRRRTSLTRASSTLAELRSQRIPSQLFLVGVLVKIAGASIAFAVNFDQSPTSISM
jgi:hypothetical protein